MFLTTVEAPPFTSAEEGLANKKWQMIVLK